MVYNAIAQSAQPIISYNYGLNESLRVRRAYLLALKTAIGCGVCFALVTIFCSPEIVGMFIDRSYPAYGIAVKGLPLYATGFVFFAVNIVSIGYFQSVERAKYATVITLLRGFILLTACFFGLPLLLGDRGIWLATPLAEMLTTLFILVIYISGKRKHKEKSVSLDKMGCTPT
jgi:Na+-driven multidrug efflux pump